MIQHYETTLLTDSNGSGIAWIGPALGELLELSYVKTDYASGVDIDVTAERSGRTVWDEDDVNSSKTVSMVAGMASSAGTAVSNLYTTHFASEDRLRIVVTSGGSGKLGTFRATFRVPSQPSPLKNPASGLFS